MTLHTRVKTILENKRATRIILAFLLFGFACGSILIGIVIYVASSQSDRIYSNVEDVPQHNVAIIFGARVRANGTLTPLLQDRVDGGIALYTSNRVSKLLMTGDNGSIYYDEVTAMKQYAISQGIPEYDIVLDYAGLDTYDSCYRAYAIFNVQDAVLVTQRYHMSRALYACNNLGVSSDGLAIEDFSRYPNLRLKYSLREYAASIKAWYDVSISERKPRYLGPQEPIL